MNMLYLSELALLPTVYHTTPTSLTLQDQFLAILPRVEAHAKVFFRHLRCPGKLDDAIAETIAIAWKWFVNATRKGKNVHEFVSTLATFAARHVRAGRRVCGQEKAGDVLSPLAQQRKHFTVSPLPVGSEKIGNVFEEALRDNTQSPVPDQAVFRIDFPAWLGTVNNRQRAVADDLMLGDRPWIVAERHKLSQGRISQIRRELLQSWEGFCTDPAEGPGPMNG